MFKLIINLAKKIQFQSFSPDVKDSNKTKVTDLSGYIYNLYQTDAEDNNTNQIEINKITNIEEVLANQVKKKKKLKFILIGRLWKRYCNQKIVERKDPIYNYE